MKRIGAKIAICLLFTFLVTVLGGIWGGLASASIFYFSAENLKNFADTSLQSVGSTVILDSVKFVLIALPFAAVIGVISLMNREPLDMRHRLRQAIFVMCGSTLLFIVAVFLYGQYRIWRHEFPILGLESSENISLNILAFALHYAGYAGLLAGVIFTGANSAFSILFQKKWTMNAYPADFPISKYLNFVPVFVVAIGLFWGMRYHSNNLGVVIYKEGFGAAMWGLAAIHIYDFGMVVIGKNSPFMQRFYSIIRDDLTNCGWWAIILFIFYIFVPDKYSFQNLDLALLTVPFFIPAIKAIWGCRGKRIAGNAMPGSVTFTLVAMLVALLLLTMYVLLQIYDKKMSEFESLWYQITVFCTALSIFIGAKQIHFYMEEQRLEVSPILINIISSLPYTAEITNLIERMTKELNVIIEKNKTEMKKNAMAQRKKTRSKKRR